MMDGMKGRLAVLASDYDGTLNQKGMVGEEDLESIRRFRAAGNRFGLVTGRAMSMIQPEIEKYDLPLDFLIAHTGALIVEYTGSGHDNRSGGRLLHFVPIPGETALELIKELYRRRAAMFGAADRDRHGLLKSDPELLRKMKNYPVIYYPEQEIRPDSHIVSFFIKDHTQDATDRLCRELSEQFRDKLSFHYNNGTIDVTAAGIGKDTGVSWIKQYYRADKAYVIGDDYNDRAMIEAFEGFGITTGKAEVKKSALAVYDRVGDCIEDILRRSEFI